MSTSTVKQWEPTELPETPYSELAALRTQEFLSLRLQLENALYLVHAYRKDLEQADAEKQALINELADYKLREQRHKEWLEEKEAQ